MGSARAMLLMVGWTVGAKSEMTNQYWKRTA